MHVRNLFLPIDGFVFAQGIGQLTGDRHEFGVCIKVFYRLWFRQSIIKGEFYDGVIIRIFSKLTQGDPLVGWLTRENALANYYDYFIASISFNRNASNCFLSGS